MSLNVDVQVLTQPGSTGSQTISLSSNFDPKAIILYAVPLTADGTAASYALGMGFGTYRGGSVQERYVAMRGLDAQGTSDTGRGSNTDALLVLQTQSAGSAGRDLEIDLTSMQTGATSEVVINWVNLHTTASIRVFAIILGGSDITDALVGDLTVGTASTTQDETVVASFGKPELVFFSHFSNTTALDEANDAAFGFGFCKQGEAGRGYFFTQNDADNNSVTAVSQRSNRCLLDSNTAGTVQWAGQLDTTVANWPTDGFRIVWDANPLEAGIVNYLALRTTAQITTGNGTAPTAGSPPVVQDLAAGFTPKLGLIFGWNDVASTAIQTASASQVGFGIGATDGTTEVWAGFTEDDAQGTMFSDQQQSTAKVIQNWNAFAAGGPTLQSEADGSFSTTNFRLSWNDIDTVAREYQWLVLGDAAGGAVTVNPAAATALGSAPAGSLAVAVAAPAVTAVGASVPQAVVVTIPASAATALGLTTAPALSQTVPGPATAATGAVGAPVLLVVVPTTTGVAAAATLAPTVIGGTGATATPAAATATAAANAPLVRVALEAAAATGLSASTAPTLLVRAFTAATTAAGATLPASPTEVASAAAATATGAAPAPLPRILVPAAAAVALGLTLDPLAFSGALVTPASMTVTDTGQVVVVIDDVAAASAVLVTDTTVGAAVSVADTTP